MFGLTLEKLLVLCVVAAVILGPRRLPDYARSLARFTRSAREKWETSRERLEQDLGVSFQNTSWERLDPRRYDPRRIIRDALREPSLTPTATAPVAAELTGGRTVVDAESSPIVEAEATPDVEASREQLSPPPEDTGVKPRPLASPSLTGRGARYRVSGSAAHPWRTPVDPPEPPDDAEPTEIEPASEADAVTTAVVPTEPAAEESARPYAPRT